MNNYIPRRRKPSHPGGDILLKLQEISIQELANHLSISRRSISRILNEQRRLSTDIAIKLAHFLGISPDEWLEMQIKLDVWFLEHKNAEVYKQIEEERKRLKYSTSEMLAEFSDHPWEDIRLKAQGITREELANCLSISRRSISRVLDGQRRLTTDNAIRFAHLFDTSPVEWLKIQKQFDVQSSELNNAQVYKRIDRERERYYQSLNNKLGLFTDHLTQCEVDFTKKVTRILRQNYMWDDFLNTEEIRNALEITCLNLESPQLLKIKTFMFEVRMAYFLNQLNMSVEYESPSNIGNSTVDFLLKGSSAWLIELTSLHESQQIKKATQKSGEYFSYLNQSSPDNDNEIIRVRKAIRSKVSRKDGVPTKFPEVTSNQYHMIIVDMRSFNIGISEDEDYWNIVYGVDDGKGVFMSDEQVQKRIHAIGFISEKKYDDCEIKDKLIIFGNPYIYHSEEDFKNSIPDQMRKNLKFLLIHTHYE